MGLQIPGDSDAGEEIQMVGVDAGKELRMAGVDAGVGTCGKWEDLALKGELLGGMVGGAFAARMWSRQF